MFEAFSVKRTMKKLIPGAMTAALVIGLGGFAAAAPIAVEWTGDSDFDNYEISFTGFTANKLIDITGDGIFHSHGGPVDVYLDIYLDGSWVNLLHGFIDNEDFDYIAGNADVSFARGTVSGLRLTSDPGQDQTFHELCTYDYCPNEGGITTFNFDNTDVPEPVTLGLFGLGLAGLGFAARRRKLD